MRKTRKQQQKNQILKEKKNENHSRKKKPTTRIVHPKKINHQQFDRKTTTMYEPFLG